MSLKLGYIPDHSAVRFSDKAPEPSAPNEQAAPAPAPASQPEPMRGLGDLVHRVLDKIGVVDFVKRREQRTKRDCGCKARREALNRAVPFQEPPST